MICQLYKENQILDIPSVSAVLPAVKFLIYFTAENAECAEIKVSFLCVLRAIGGYTLQHLTAFA